MQIRSLLLVCMALGCGGDIIALLPARGSCNVPSTGTCTDYVGTAWSAPSSGSQACLMVGNGAVFYNAVCASTDRVGSCRMSPGAATEVATRYYSGRFNVSVAMYACSQVGGLYVVN